MKKKILIVIVGYDSLGGKENALMSLLDKIPQDRYDVFLMSLKNDNPVYKIPKNIKTINAPFKFNIDANEGVKSIIKNYLKEKNWKSLVIVFIGYIYGRLSGNYSILRNRIFDEGNLLFDYVFNFQGPNLIVSVICEDICICEKKFIRIHSDYFNFVERYRIFSWIKKIIEKYKDKNILKYDQIFCVSEEITLKLNEIYKSKKIKTLYNVIDKEKILRLGREKGFDDQFGGIRILSVGRLFYVKGFDVACNVCKNLINKGYNIKWYIIGEGMEEKKIMDLIKKNKLENYFILLGGKVNPYPYFKGCDIYVQPSRSEAFCLTVAEAKLFYKPIVATKFPGAKEQIKDKVTGLLVDMDVNEIEEAVEKLILNGNLRNFLSNNLRVLKNDKTISSDFSNLEQFM